MFDKYRRILLFIRIDKPFTCSRCLICTSCSVHVISTYYVRKGSWPFLNLVTHKSTRSGNLITWQLVPQAFEIPGRALFKEAEVTLSGTNKVYKVGGVPGRSDSPHHVVLSVPCFLLSVAVHLRAALGIWSWGILGTCPNITVLYHVLLSVPCFLLSVAVHLRAAFIGIWPWGILGTYQADVCYVLCCVVLCYNARGLSSQIARSIFLIL